MESPFRGDAMKLGSLKEGGRDGTLVLVSNDLKRIIPIETIAPTFQKAIENWAIVEPQLMDISVKQKEKKRNT